MNNSLSLALVVVGAICGNAQTTKDSLKSKTIPEVELFGERKKQNKGMEVITRMPLKVRDQIQSISVISDRAIEEMGALTVTDAAKNIPGVVLFSTYGDGEESMSIRGYRGTPVLKNGVLMYSDFRTSSILTDMQGVESLQVIRGSVAITQGIGSSLGAAGGVINLTTKKPKFINAGTVGFRYGNWNLFRPTLDIQRVLDSEGKVAFRLNAAYENKESFADYVKGERLYINPSVSYRPDDKTNITVEMDYMYNQNTPNRGTVNLAPDDTNALYELPTNKFLGFKTNFNKTTSLNFGAYADRKLGDKFRVRIAYLQGDVSNNGESYSLATVTYPDPKNPKKQIIKDYKERNRRWTKFSSEDHSKVFQADFIGQEVETGFLKHTFQIGFDWKESYTLSGTYQHKFLTEVVRGKTSPLSYIPIDKIADVTGEFTNDLPATFNPDDLVHKGDRISAKSPIYGITAQEVMAIGKYAKAVLGIRYSSYQGNNQTGKKDAWNPSLGLMISPLENMNIYGSFTTTTDLRGNDRVLANGEGTIGATITQQWEAGFKSDWFDEKLRFNLNLYAMNLNNLSYEVLDAAGNGTKTYDFAGDLTRKGVEIDLIGKILPELEVMAGYSYLDAKYKNSPAYVNDSRPMMAAEHTANAWLNYTFRSGALKGFNIGGGAYYVGERPVNEYTQKVIIHNTTPGVKPFNLNAYTTLNLQAGYTYKNVGVRVFANNLNNALGYNAYYRGGYINRNDPRNFAVQVNYKF